MSYCLFSCDDFTSDVYVYQSDPMDCMGTAIGKLWTIHVASNRIVGKCPTIVPALGTSTVPPEEYFDAYRRQSEWLRSAASVAIGGPSDGTTIYCDGPGQCADELERLRAEGYHVPQFAIDELRVEAGGES